MRARCGDVSAGADELRARCDHSSVARRCPGLDQRKDSLSPRPEPERNALVRLAEEIRRENEVGSSGFDARITVNPARCLQGRRGRGGSELPTSGDHLRLGIDKGELLDVGPQRRRGPRRNPGACANVEHRARPPAGKVRRKTTKHCDRRGIGGRRPVCRVGRNLLARAGDSRGARSSRTVGLREPGGRSLQPWSVVRADECLDGCAQRERQLGRGRRLRQADETTE